MTNDDDEKYYDDDDKENNEKELIEFRESLLSDFSKTSGKNYRMTTTMTNFTA